jgi:hypothetical protein
MDINRISGIGLLVLSLSASVVPWLLVWLRGFDQPPLADEGAAAHIFQLSVAALLPVTVIFFATADWARPAQIVKRVAVPAVLVILAFAFVFYYERVYIPAHF